MNITKPAFITLMLICMVSMSFSEKKNPPRNTRAVEQALMEAGEPHFPEDIDVQKLGPIKHNETYFHVYAASLDTNYRVLFFNNTPTYLGYYEVVFEPVDYEEGAVLLAAGGGTYFSLPLSKEGPAKEVVIDGAPTPFIINEKANKGPEKTTEDESSDAPKIVYRMWTVNIKGRDIPVKALFVKKEGSQIFLQDEKRGIVKGFSLSKLGKEDVAYLRTIGAL